MEAEAAKAMERIRQMNEDVDRMEREEARERERLAKAERAIRCRRAAHGVVEATRRPGCRPARRAAADAAGGLLIPKEAAPQFRDDVAPHNGMMPPPNSEMIAPPITE